MKSHTQPAAKVVVGYVTGLTLGFDNVDNGLRQGGRKERMGDGLDVHTQYPQPHISYCMEYYYIS